MYRLNPWFILSVLFCLLVPTVYWLAGVNPRPSSVVVGFAAFALLTFRLIGHYNETPTIGRLGVALIMLSLLLGAAGTAQVSGRGDASFRSRIAMDMVYLRARRLRLDLKILARTVPAVMWGRGSY